jgi:transmembrane sensor
MTDLNHMRTLFPKEQPPERVHRMWQAVQAEYGRRRVPERRRRWSAALAYGGIAAAAVLVGVLVLSRPAETTVALTTERGEPIPFVIATAEVSLDYHFSDGSSIRVDSGSKLELIESSAEAVRFALAEGRTRFDIKPGGPRKWQVDLGSVLVTVLGTAFWVEKSADHVSVEVERGVVLVSGDGVEGRERRLIAGNTIRVDKPAEPLATEEKAKPDTDELSIARDTDDRQEPLHPSWRTHASAGRYTEAFLELGASGFAAAVARAKSADELFGLADVARLGGHPEHAVGPLRIIMRNFKKDPKAGLAAYTLGRLYLEQLSSPREATAAFDEALALGLPDALVEAFKVKLIRSLILQDDARGNTLASEYLRRYPNGRYREQVQSLVEEKQHQNQ